MVRIISTLLALIVIQATLSFGQVAKVKGKKVKLVDWKANACDNTYDPNLLVNRITEINVQNEVTYLTVNFTANCCAEFKPQISFKNNKLFLLPYKEYSGDYCTCDCCFSIEYIIEGLPSSGYTTYYNGKRVEFSRDHYKVVLPTREVYKGDTINRTNRYGFKEDLWMTFYENGNLKTLEKYPESELYYEPWPLWEKSFYPSGRVSSYERKDTSEYWFEDGGLKGELIKYKIGDTTYEKEFVRYDNRQVSKNSLERTYPTIFRSEFDSTYKGEGSMIEMIYKEEFFENGQVKFRFGKDTTYTWYSSGKIASREFKKEKIEYDEDGFVTERDIHWNTKGPSFWGDMNNSIYADIGRNGKVLKIHYVRDEPAEGGIAAGVHYYWTWDEAGKLIEFPREWTEEFPWTPFMQLLVP